MNRHLRVAVVAGFPPDPQGEADYSGKVFTAMAREFSEDVELMLLAHRQGARRVENILPNLTVKRITRPESRLVRHFGFATLWREIVAFHPDVVHMEGIHTGLYGGLFGEPMTLLFLFLRLLGKPSLLTIHSTWMPADLDELCREKQLGPLGSKCFRWYFQTNLKTLVQLADSSSIATAGALEAVLAEYARAYGLDKTRLRIESHPCTYMPVSNEEQQACKAACGLSGRRVILASGFVRPDKGYDLLLQCAPDLLERFRDVVIIIAGQPQRSSDREYAEKLLDLRSRVPASDRLVLKFEYLSDDLFNQFFNAADVVVVPYLRSIAPSGPIHHALGRGKAVVASKAGHNAGLESVCKLFETGSATALGEALSGLLEDERELDKYKQLAREYAARHTWEGLAREYVSQYRALIAANGRGNLASTP
jgi:glycosyltransferase involved in cell wall biosynthesis